MTAPPPDGQNAPSDPDPVKAARRLARENERLRATLTHLEQMRDTNARTLDRVRSELDALLLNVFPKPIIDRLNAGETLIADRHDDVTVSAISSGSPRSRRGSRSRNWSPGSTACSRASTRAVTGSV
jgi:hypothetical protein